MTDSPWWRDAVCYEVYLRSFADSDGDGLGDLEGVRQRLPYLADLGVDAVWVTPFYPSPMHDHGYDVADYCDVDPRFGNLADVDRLVADAHRLGLRLVIDVVPNHTSVDHPWFRAALSDPGAAERDWYLFRPGRPDGGPPNNWQSVFGGSAWTRDPASGEFYLHLFDRSQPDLNWRNPDVHAAFRDVLRFWFDRGVDGFRIDVAHALYKDADLRDNPPDDDLARAWDQPETVDVWQEWRTIADSYDDRMFVGEVFLFDPDRVARYVGPDRLQQAFNFAVARTPYDAAAFRDIVQRSLQLFGRDGTTPTWVLSNHDLVRHASRYGGPTGVRRARAVTALLLALPGSPYLYQGEELGLEQTDVPPELRQDPVWFRSGRPGRDGARTPIPWTAQPPGYGFTTGTPWLPFDPAAPNRNVASETDDAASTLTFYRRALRLRREVVVALDDEVRWLSTPAGAVGVARGDLTVVANMSSEPALVSLAPESAVLLTSDAAPTVDAHGVTVPPDTTVWLRTMSRGSAGRHGSAGRARE